MTPAQQGLTNAFLIILFYTKGDDWTWNPVYTASAAGQQGARPRHLMGTIMPTGCCRLPARGPGRALQSW